MARIYDVACLKCGEVMEWCKYNPPFDKCDLCGSKLTDRTGEWDEGKARVFGVWSSNSDVYATSKRIRIAFFREKVCYRFRLQDGRLCTVKLREFPEFWLTLKTGGEKVSLLYISSALSEAVSLLRDKNLATEAGLLLIRYHGVLYSPQHNAAKTILKAIKENLKPEIAAVFR